MLMNFVSVPVNGPSNYPYTMLPDTSSPPFSVLDFYTDKTIFITGATGFIGKILLEKLLRIGRPRKIYVLLRAKKGKAPKERLEHLLNDSPVFHFFPELLDLKKVVPIDGDITKPHLGISGEDWLALTSEVDVVFHSAAFVYFKGELRQFIEQNVYGTDAVMQLCTQMNHLKAVIYVSTAYANTHLPEIEERIYPLDNPDVDQLVGEILSSYGHLTPKQGHPVLRGRPNSYTLSKALAEWLVTKKYSHRLPVTVVRPSIVTHSLSEPAKGWCDTKNGVAGAMILGGLGIARTMIINTQGKADCIPVDYVVNSMIVIAACMAIYPLPPQQRPKVFHLTTGQKNPITWGEILDYSRRAVESKPFLKQIRPLARKPVASETLTGRVCHHLTKIFSHYCFALLVDFAMLVMGQKPFLLNITKRMHQGFDTLQPFSSQEWIFHYQNYMEVYRMLPVEEKQLFQSDVTTIDWHKYIDDATLGTRRYLLKEDDSTIQTALKRQRILNMVYGTLEKIFYLILVIFILWKIFSSI